MATPDQPGRHHYTPVFYLRRWCNPAGMLKVWRKGADGLTAFEAAPERVGVERHLWALTNPPDGDRQRVERDFFAPLDSGAATIAARLVNGELGLSVAERLTWAAFVSSLHLRLPEHIHRLRRDVPKMLADLLSAPDPEFERVRGDHPAKTAAEYAAVEAPHLLTDAGVYIIPQVLTEGGSVRTIAGMDWSVRSFPRSTRTLLTSDAPMLLMTPLQNPECLIVLPLSPRHAFFASRRAATLDNLGTTAERVLVRRINEAVALTARAAVIGDCEERFLQARLGRARMAQPET